MIRSRRDLWVDDHAEDLLDLPEDEATAEVAAAGYRPIVHRPGAVYALPNAPDAVVLRVNAAGDVIDVRPG